MSENSPASSPASGDDAVLAGRYINALFALAEQDGMVDEVVADMQNLRVLWEESPEWRFIACDPRLNLENVGMVVEEVSKIAKVNKVTANFLSIVAQNRRLNLLPILVDTFMDEVGTRRGEFRADVHTARPLTPPQREKLEALLSAPTGGKIRLSVVEDPSIIGGLTVKIGSQFVDASVKTKLDYLERTLRGAA